MMSYGNRAYLLVAFLMLAPAARGADEPSVSLTVGKAVDLALTQNPRVLGAREKMFEFGQLVRQVRGDALPRLESTVSVRRNRDPGLRNSPFFSRLLEGPEPIPAEALQPFFFTNYLWQLDLEQPVYTFGRVQHALEAARHELEGVRLDIRGVENLVSRDVALACYDFLLADQRLEVLATERRARERQLQQVEDRVLRLQIDANRRLVQEQELWSGQQGTGEEDALLLAAR